MQIAHRRMRYELEVKACDRYSGRPLSARSRLHQLKLKTTTEPSDAITTQIYFARIIVFCECALEVRVGRLQNAHLVRVVHFIIIQCPGTICVLQHVCALYRLPHVWSSITTVGVSHETYTYQFSCTINQFHSSLSPLQRKHPHFAPKRFNVIILKPWHQYKPLVIQHACNVMLTPIFFFPT